MVRKLLFGLLLLNFYSISSNAQSAIYGDEWIEYSQHYFKIKVTADGLYRIYYPQLNDALAVSGYSLASINPKNFQLFYRGQEEFIHIEGEADNVFNETDYIEFYGRFNNGEIDTRLYEDPNFQANTYASMFTDTSVYFLTWNFSESNNRVENLFNNLDALPTAESHYRFQSFMMNGTVGVFNKSTSYLSYGVPYLEIYSSKFEEGEGYTESRFANSTRTKTLTTTNAYFGDDADAVTLKTVVIGNNDVSHHYTITVNGVVMTDTSYFGFNMAKYNFILDTIKASNTIAFASLGGSTDYLRNGYIDINYARSWDFNNASRVGFTLANSASATKYFEVTDFNESATNPVLYDLTNHKRIIGIVESDISKFHLSYDASNADMWLSSQDTLVDILKITSLTPVTFKDYSIVANQGDYIIITNPVLYADIATGVNWVQEYANYRSSFAGGNYNVLIIDINSLYDQFAYGDKKNPLAIRDFSLYAADSFSVAPKYVFLIGKAISYDYNRNSTTNNNNNLVPTFGTPGSDILLTSRLGEVYPEIPVGRLVARTGDDVRKYYQKVVEYEAVQQSSMQTIENKAWMKNILHFAGGLSVYEQTLFNNYLIAYKNIIQDTLYGANVFQFNKVSTDPIYYSTDTYIDSLINSGVSLLTFFGHSSANSFDFNIGDPNNLENAGKYNIVFGNGCYTGAVHETGGTLSEDYILAESKGSVGFLAAATYTLASSLNTYAKYFYKDLGIYNYGDGIGKIMQSVTDSIADYPNVYDRLTAEHTTLNGDPALTLNTHQKPDFVIEEPSVTFNPEIVSTVDDSLQIQVVITNIGQSVNAIISTSIKRINPLGTITELNKEIEAPYFRDTLVFKFPIDKLNDVGINAFTIYVDNLLAVEEMDEMNNVLNISTNIISDDALPVYPYEYSLINQVPAYLAASTSNIFADYKQYRFDIDTTELFNSALKKTKTVVKSGGVLYWDNPNITWIDNTVYYWRITLDTIYDNDPIWRKSSFLYKNGPEIGWNQSHYFQYLNDSYYQMLMNTNRNFAFVNDIKNYQVNTGIYPVTDWTEVTSYINGEEIALGSCASNGFVIFVINPLTGLPWTTYEIGDTGFGPYGDVYCGDDEFRPVIQMNTNTLESRTNVYNLMMDSVPEGFYFLCYSNNYAKFNEWLDDTTATGGTSLFDAFLSYGASEILDLAEYDVDRSYIFFGRKGDPSLAQEIIGDSIGNKISFSTDIIGRWYKGDVTSTKVGPASQWDKVLWQFTDPTGEASDSTFLEIIGEDWNGNQTMLANNITADEYDLSSVDPIIYPYLRLNMFSQNDSLRIPAQIDYWRVVYTPVPEAALNPGSHFVFLRDTIDQGQPLLFEVSIDNVSAWNMDSILISYSVRDNSNNVIPITYPRQDSLFKFNNMITKMSVDTWELPAGKATLIVEVNPNNDQPEQYHFNNIAYLPFFITGDNADPLLDVTFDNVHILDGDIVSAKPEIKINLNDENRFLALNDTSLLDISFKYPDGTVMKMYFNNGLMEFFPADSNNLDQQNQAEVIVKNIFNKDGVYELWITANDVSGNLAGGGIDYRISFEVINKPMISNVLNYPNPFTTQTHFVFTLTGNEVPDYFKIQIMTVTGRIIKEILKPELGPIHIGNNITEYVWNGTDKFGDPVANGLYLYRIVAKLNGKELDKYNTGTDQYFKADFGKMYLAR
ncbi:MAG: hypothetical protein IPL48_10105 [Bacteroidetes bacterium]|nr:hypothetical protein [Bacteroidota bacterium]